MNVPRRSDDGVGHVQSGPDFYGHAIGFTEIQDQSTPLDRDLRLRAVVQAPGGLQLVNACSRVDAATANNRRTRRFSGCHEADVDITVGDWRRERQRTDGRCAFART